MTKEQIEKLRTLLDTDLNINQIAEQLGISYNTLRIRLSDGDMVIKRRLCYRNGELVGDTGTTFDTSSETDFSSPISLTKQEAVTA